MGCPGLGRDVVGAWGPTGLGLPQTATALFEADREALGLGRYESLLHLRYQRSLDLREKRPGFDGPREAKKRRRGGGRDERQGAILTPRDKGFPYDAGFARYATADPVHRLFFEGRSRKQTYRVRRIRSTGARDDWSVRDGPPGAGRSAAAGQVDRSYTFGMKTAISLPDGIFREAERLARRLKKSRSQLYQEAVAEYVARHAPEAITEAMNDLAAKVDTRLEPFSSRAARRVLERSEW